MASVWLLVLSLAHWAFSLALVFVGLLASFLRSGRRVERSVGFFHPFTSDGGGGERVLWCAVREVQRMDTNVETVVYTGDDLSGAELTKRAKERFGIELLRPIGVVKLTRCKWTRPEHYPVFTMVGQALGSIILTAEALLKYRPDVFFDTVGHAFGYPLVRLAGSEVAAYVHYPTISTDMIRRVRNRDAAYNNDTSVANSTLKSWVKWTYYNLFAILYGLCGKFASVVAVNSSWTKGHVTRLWGGTPHTVFPPCDVASLLDTSVGRSVFDSRLTQDSEPSTSTGSKINQQKVVVSVGQFRPEKDHALQLKAWARMKKTIVKCGKKGKGTTKSDNSSILPSARLKFVGGCRGEADELRLQSLRDLCVELKIENSVDFHVDVPFSELKRLLAKSHFGLHAMVDEHFGICVVEYMAAGAVPIAHASAGPAMDIVVPCVGVDGASYNFSNTKSVGFLATTESEYAECLKQALLMSDSDRDAMAERARVRAARFGEAQFAVGLSDALKNVMRKMDARDLRRKELREVIAAERVARTPSPAKRRGTPRGTPEEKNVTPRNSSFLSPRRLPRQHGESSGRKREREIGKSPLKPKRL